MTRDTATVAGQMLEMKQLPCSEFNLIGMAVEREQDDREAISKSKWFIASDPSGEHRQNQPDNGDPWIR